MSAHGNHTRLIESGATLNSRVSMCDVVAEVGTYNKRQAADLAPCTHCSLLRTCERGLDV